MTSSERLQFIINEVKQGKVLILEQGLTPSEQFELNKMTMSEIDHESFIGIEMPGFAADFKKPGFFDRLFRRRKGPRMMAIGPAKLMKIIKKEPSLIQTMIVPSGEEGALGEGIPLDEDGNEILPEAAPADEEKEIPESQSKLDEFERGQAELQENHERREELEMLIGPELREGADDEKGPGSEDAGISESTVEDEKVDAASDESETAETDPDQSGGYVLRKIKDESEDE
jgi:hypothetical protein